MKKVSPLLGRKRTVGQKRRHRAGILRAIADGKPFGRKADPQTHHEKRICQLPACGVEFPFLVQPCTDSQAGRYCNQKHAVLHTAILRMKVPDDYDLLFDLYVTKRMSTPEIAEMFNSQHHAVLNRLKALGIPTRKVGHSRNVICKVKGCNEPVFKLKHPQNGSSYGTRCEKHYWEHRKFLRVSWYSRKQEERGNIPDAICRVLTEGVKSSPEIAAELGVSTKVVSTTIGHLRRNGRVEVAGTYSVPKDRVKRFLWRLVEHESAIAA